MLQIKTILFFAFLSFLAFWLVKRLRYFEDPYQAREPFVCPKISWLQLCIAFILYFAAFFWGGVILNSLRLVTASKNGLASLQLLLLSCTAATLYVFYKLQKDRVNARAIFKTPPLFSSPLQCLQIAIFSFILAFPFITFVGELVNTLLYLIFGVFEYEQLAVYYLRMSSGFPLFVALFTIVLFAPITEEFLFRGLLFNCLERKLGRTKGLMLSSLCFAGFHFSSSQGLGNISILFSLFVLSIFLGYIYRRERSLVAPIALHMLFNTVGTLRILYTS